MNRDLLTSILCLLVFAAVPPLSRAQAPVFQFTTGESTIKFDVESSVAIVGKFDKWDATLTFSRSQTA